MDQEHLDEIIRDNPNVDPTAIERSRQAAKQLADAGIKLGGYRLMPALGGLISKDSGIITEQDTYRTQGR